MASIVSCRFLLCFNISPSFFPRTSSPPASCHFPSASLLTTQAFAFHSSACLSSLFFLFFSPLRSFYLTHTVIVKPRVQMLRSVPPSFSMWSCEKTREPRLECIGRFFARPRVCTHNTEPLDTNTLEEHFFCSFFFFFFLAHVYLARCSPNGSGWAELRSERWNGVRGENGSKEHQGHLADVLHRCFCDIISGAQQKAASDIHFRSFFQLTLAASTPMWWRDGSASVSTEHRGVMGVAVFRLAGVTAELLLLL